jgi:uncharacterized caspase-like protein
MRHHNQEVTSRSFWIFLLALYVVQPALGGTAALAERGTGPTSSRRDAAVSLGEEDKGPVIQRSALVTVQNTSEAQANQSPLRPSLWVLAIGVAEYQNRNLKLEYSAKDAEAFSKLWQIQESGLYASVSLRVLLNQDATKRKIEEGLDWIGKQTKEGDVALVFLAGHGLTSPTGQYYFLPYEADIDQEISTMLPAVVLRSWLSGVKGKVLFFLDTCHSGGVFPRERSRGLTAQADLAQELISAPNGTVAYTASSGGQVSLESRVWGHGAFTKALLEGLAGAADRDGTGRVTVNTLEWYLSTRVVELTHGRQRPNTAKPQALPDFPIALIRTLRNEDIQPLR